MIGGGTPNIGEGKYVVDATVEGALMKDILLSILGAINVSSTNVSVLGSIGEASRGEPGS
jgi:hypothetical protein